MAELLSVDEARNYRNSGIDLIALVGNDTPGDWVPARTMADVPVGTVAYVSAMGGLRRGAVVRTTRTKVHVALTTGGATTWAGSSRATIRVQTVIAELGYVWVAPKLEIDPQLEEFYARVQSVREQSGISHADGVAKVLDIDHHHAQKEDRKRSRAEIVEASLTAVAEVEQDEPDDECPSCGGPLATDGVCADDECGADFPERDELMDSERHASPVIEFAEKTLGLTLPPWQRRLAVRAFETEADDDDDDDDLLAGIMEFSTRSTEMPDGVYSEAEYRAAGLDPEGNWLDEGTVPFMVTKTDVQTRRIDSLMDSGVEQATVPGLAPRPETHGSTVVRLLERIWLRLRADHPELPEVVIVTGSGLLGASKWGHFRAEGWKTKADGARVHEMFLAGEALAKGARQVLQTMIHEAAHALAAVRKVQDTSRQGRWHNREFVKIANELGLEHKGEKGDKTHGYSAVTLTSALEALYADLLAELDAEIHLVCHLPSWLGGEDEPQGGERMGAAPKVQGEEPKSGNNLKAVCGCAEPNIIRLSRKVLDLEVVRCDLCDNLFTAE